MTSGVSPVPTTGAHHENIGHVIFIAAGAALGGLLFGYDSSVINGAVDGIKGHFQVGSGTTGLIVSSALLGSALGAMVGGRVADRRGRLLVMRTAAILFFISGIGSALPFAAWDLAVWRVIGGFAIGLASVIGPTYIAEVAPPAYRGRLASFQQMAIVVGIALSQLVNYAIAEAAGGNTRGHLGGLEAWQWMLGAEAVPALFYLIFGLIIPESPRYLVMSGQLEKARAVLKGIEGRGIDVTGQIREIQEVLRSEHRPTLRDLRGRVGFMPIVWVGIGLSVLQQFVGINVIFYYSSSLWQAVGINQSNSLLISLSSSLINILGTLIAMSLVDKIGRKPLALIGSAGMTVSLGVVAWAFAGGAKSGGTVHLPGAHGTIALVGANFFVLFFALSWGVVVWVLLGEMFPNRIRAAALSVATAAQWLANWLITVSFPTMSGWSLSGSYVIYAAFAFVSIGFVSFLPETKGRALEEMG
jgi:SP family sugar:H+ symporter-like MFS transporter